MRRPAARRRRPDSTEPPAGRRLRRTARAGALALAVLAAGVPVTAAAPAPGGGGRTPVTVDVQATNTPVNQFVPASVTIRVGDTVRWTNVGGFHSVSSCDGVNDPPQCGGQVAAEGAFTSGPPSFSWTFSQVFTRPGLNPYFCEPHVAFGMTGTVEVLPAAPPPVPDGSFGTPMTVAKLDPAGNDLSIAWDTGTCLGADDHRLIHGTAGQLPPGSGGGHVPAGGLCAVGTASPATWSGSPAPIPGPAGWVWFLMIADDGSGVEGSWGTTGDGAERNGPGPDGASGECGATAKDLTNTCG